MILASRCSASLHLLCLELQPHDRGRRYKNGCRLRHCSNACRLGSTLGRSSFMGRSVQRGLFQFNRSRSCPKTSIGHRLDVTGRAFEDRQPLLRQRSGKSAKKPSRWDTVKTHEHPKGEPKQRIRRPEQNEDQPKIGQESVDLENSVLKKEIREPPEARAWRRRVNDPSRKQAYFENRDFLKEAQSQALALRERLRKFDLKKVREVDYRKKLKELDFRKLKDVDMKKLISTTTDKARSTPLPLAEPLLATVGAVFVIGLIMDMLFWRMTRGAGMKNVKANVISADNFAVSEQDTARARAPSALSVLLGKDLGRKESVEWLNMIIDKLWNLYRRGLEEWFVSVLQPTIDNLEKPPYVEKVTVKQFFLGDEPMSIRTVERRTSRRADDLQYHVGVRYTGGARLLLLISLKWGILPVTIPVGVRGIDVDAELWVKFRMIPTEPWVSQATWAFVTLPKIKLALAPFRLVNLMSVPFLSIFLAKLLTEDLPQLFVRPNKNVVNFLQGTAIGPVNKDFKDSVFTDRSSYFSGELSITLIECRKLSYIPYLKTDPYVIFVLGEQVVRSKKNSQTSIIGPPGAPVWNQDFKFLVVDQKVQYLSLTVHDTLGFTSYPVGSTEVDLRSLRDTVPVDRKLVLKSGWGPFPKRFAGEILVRLTYKAYIDDEGQEIPVGPGDGILSNGHELAGQAVEQAQEVAKFFKEEAGKVAEFFQEKDVAKEIFQSLTPISSGKDAERVLPLRDGLRKSDDHHHHHKGNPSDGNHGVEEKGSGNLGKQVILQNKDEEKVKTIVTDENPTEVPPVVWVAAVAGIGLLVAMNLHLFNFVNP